MLKKTTIIFTIICLSLLLIIVGFENWTNLKQTPLAPIRIKKESPTLSQSPSPTTSPTPTPTTIPPISLSTIFKTDHSWTNNLAEDKTITIITTGDVIPARTVNFKMNEYNDFTHPWLKTANTLKQVDLTLINLEAPLIKNCPITNEGMVFCGDQRFVEGLKYADIDAINLANNHTLNYGADGINQTKTLLNNNKILNFGYPENELKIQKIRNSRIGFLGFNLLEPMDEKELLTLISNSKKKADILVVSIHWGTEYTHEPSPQHKTLATRIIDEGADLIIGNHPHWIQPLEIYKNKLIVYAHGNFIFDQEWSEKTKTGFIAKHTFWENKLINTEIIPIYISDYNQPEILQNEKKQKVLDKLKEISLK